MIRRLRHTWVVGATVLALLVGLSVVLETGSTRRAHAAVAAVPDSPTAEAGNPIVDGWYADPDMAVYGGRYWVYPTTSRGYHEQTFMDAFSSTDLVNWTKHPKVLDVADVSWARYALWAPAPVARNGKYYLYFAANDVQDNSQLGGIGVAVADRPEGPYKDAIGRPLISRFHNGAQPIDQDVFIDDDGQAYMYYGGWHHSNVVKLDPDMISLSTFADGSTYKEITPENYTEGSLMFKRNGTYYFMWSEGGWTGPDYSVSYAMSDSPTGPFKKIQKVLAQDPAVARGSGHHTVVNVPGTDTWYIVYHRRPLSETDGNHRVLAYDRMHFNSDGTLQPIRMGVKDNFADGNALGWRTYGGAWSVTGGQYAVGVSQGGKSLLDTDFSDLVHEADVSLTSGGGDAGVVFRAVEPTTGTDGYRGYYAGISSSGRVLLGKAANNWTQLASAAMDVSPNTAYRLRVEAVGSSIKVYVNDMSAPKISVDDSSHASGAVGLRAHNAAARFDNVSAQSDVVGLEASNQSNQFVRHAGSRGRIDANVAPFQDSQWKVVPGLADRAAVSLESVNRPGHYLRHRHGEVWLDPTAGTTQYRADATWHRRQGLAGASLVSFESYNFPGRYLRHRFSVLYSEPVPGALDRWDASFRLR
ncbi:family 43 glycosylhydrolase [Streptomyces sp. NPDC058637]|uniref:family 43 glycosylhydrolase n=1 Tax=Streptomyces sp. NPDC058637 TaxID=3346569 RepID=UPI00365DA78D